MNKFRTAGYDFFGRQTVKPETRLCLALLLTGLVGCSTANKSPRQYLVSYDPSEHPYILSYSKPSPETLQQIKVEHMSLSKEELNKLTALPKSKTNNGVRWLVEDTPDTMRGGPWNTQLYIFEAVDTNHCVRVELINHGSGGVHHTWLNDKLLFVRAWFGRIAWTDFVLDSETLRFAYIEDGRLDEVLDRQEK